MKKVINELYCAIQGEGSRAGLPTIVVRTTGCTHRCYFGEEGGWCDSWYTSIHPSPGIYDAHDVKELYEKNPHIKEMMITGGSPTMHNDLINELNNFAIEKGIFVTIETEGSHKIVTDNLIDLISFSPKFSNTIPNLGIKTPMGNVVTRQMINQHNKLRLNKEAIKWNIENHLNYHFKPVINPIHDDIIWNEIVSFMDELKIPKEKVWIMPPGDSREKLVKNYPDVIEFCWQHGYNFTGRPHIIAFDTKRQV